MRRAMAMQYLPPSELVAELHTRVHEAAAIPGLGAVYTTTADGYDVSRATTFSRTQTPG